MQEDIFTTYNNSANILLESYKIISRYPSIKVNFVEKLLTELGNSDFENIQPIVYEYIATALKTIETYDNNDLKNTVALLLAKIELLSENFADAIYNCMKLLKIKFDEKDIQASIIKESIVNLIDKDIEKLTIDDKEAIKDGLAVLTNIHKDDPIVFMLQADFSHKYGQNAVSLKNYIKTYELQKKQGIIDTEIALRISVLASSLDSAEIALPYIKECIINENKKRHDVVDPTEFARIVENFINLTIEAGIIHLKQNKTEKAEKLFSQLHNFLPSNPAVLSYLAEARAKIPHKDFEEIVGILDELETLHQLPEDVEKLVVKELKQAEILCEIQKRPDLAIAVIERLPEDYINPDLTDLTELQAAVQMRYCFCKLLINQGNKNEIFEQSKTIFEQFIKTPMIFGLYINILAIMQKEEEIQKLLMDENAYSFMQEHSNMPKEVIDFAKTFIHLLEEGDYISAGDELKALRDFINPKVKFMYAPLVLHSCFLYGPYPPKILREEMVQSFEELVQMWDMIPPIYRAMNGLEFYEIIWKISQNPKDYAQLPDIADTPPLGKIFNETFYQSKMKQNFGQIFAEIENTDFVPSMITWLRVAKTLKQKENLDAAQLAMFMSAVSKNTVEQIDETEVFDLAETLLPEMFGRLEDFENKFEDFDPSEENPESQMLKQQLEMVFIVFPIIRFLQDLKLIFPESYRKLEEDILPGNQAAFDVFNYISKITKTFEDF